MNESMDELLVSELLAEAHTAGGPGLLADAGSLATHPRGRNGQAPWGIAALLCHDLENGATDLADRVLRYPDSLWRSWSGPHGSLEYLGDFLPAVAAAHTADRRLCEDYLERLRQNMHWDLGRSLSILMSLAVSRDYRKAKELAGVTVGRLLPDHGPQSPLAADVIIPWVLRIATATDGGWWGSGPRPSETPSAQPRLCDNSLRPVLSTASARWLDGLSEGDIRDVRTSVVIDRHFSCPAALDGKRSRALSKRGRAAMRDPRMGPVLPDGIKSRCHDDTLVDLLGGCGWSYAEWEDRIRRMAENGLSVPAAMSMHSAFLARKAGHSVGRGTRAALNDAAERMSKRGDRHGASYAAVAAALMKDPSDGPGPASSAASLLLDEDISPAAVLQYSVAACTAGRDRMTEDIADLCERQGRWEEGLMAGHSIGALGAVSADGAEAASYDIDSIPDHVLWSVVRRDTLPDEVIARRTSVQSLQKRITRTDEQNGGWIRRRMLSMLLRTVMSDPANSTGRMTLLRRTFWEAGDSTCAEYDDFLRGFYDMPAG